MNCIHLGEPTGTTVLCPQCSGKVALKLFTCAIHGVCTPVRAVKGVACCNGTLDDRDILKPCGEYELCQKHGPTA